MDYNYGIHQSALYYCQFLNQPNTHGHFLLTSMVEGLDNAFLTEYCCNGFRI